jgi:hypothetical protein
MIICVLVDVSELPSSEQCRIVHSRTAIPHCMQAVPSSPNLYRNSFTYETVKDLPPDFAACNKFIGEQELFTRQQLRFQCP